MIVADLKQIEQQAATTPALRKAIAFLRRKDIANLPDGKTEIEEDRVFALVQRYETAATDDPTFECHRKYIDIQLIVSGEETIGWASVESMTITEAYTADKDVCFGKVAAGKWTPVHLAAGQCAVLWPEDGHAPKLVVDAPCAVMKIVVKVAV